MPLSSVYAKALSADASFRLTLREFSVIFFYSYLVLFSPLEVALHKRSMPKRQRKERVFGNAKASARFCDF